LDVALDSLIQTEQEMVPSFAANAPAGEAKSSAPAKAKISDNVASEIFKLKKSNRKKFE